MPTFADARHLILTNIVPLGAEPVGLVDAVGRVLAEDVVAPWDMPRCDNSAMDGFAVRACDCAESTILKITGYIAAGGTARTAVESGCAIKIMTGAPVPAGCDAVVPFEDAEEIGNCVRVKAKVARRQHMRYKGEDVRCGERIMHAGTLIRPAEISMLASFGNSTVSVYRKPRVAIVATGDELVEVGDTLAPGKIINSNSPALAAAVKDAGAIPVVLGIARDDRESHRALLREGLKADVLITSAGVSAGDRDLVRKVLGELGARQVFWRVDIKPGGPTAFALYEGRPVFSLPGNPVATMITFEEFVRPALLKMMGHKRVIKPMRAAVLKHAVKKKPGKMKILRVKLEYEDGRAVAVSAGDQNTGMLKTMLVADALAMLPAESTSLAAGDTVDIHVLSDDIDMLEG